MEKIIIRLKTDDEDLKKEVSTGFAELHESVFGTSDRYIPITEVCLKLSVQGGTSKFAKHNILVSLRQKLKEHIAYIIKHEDPTMKKRINLKSKVFDKDRPVDILRKLGIFDFTNLYSDSDTAQYRNSGFNIIQETLDTAVPKIKRFRIATNQTISNTLFSAFILTEMMIMAHSDMDWTTRLFVDDYRNKKYKKVLYGLKLDVQTTLLIKSTIKNLNSFVDKLVDRESFKHILAILYCAYIDVMMNRTEVEIVKEGDIDE